MSCTINEVAIYEGGKYLLNLYLGPVSIQLGGHLVMSDGHYINIENSNPRELAATAI